MKDRMEFHAGGKFKLICFCSYFFEDGVRS
jgi:hypothetical protein